MKKLCLILTLFLLIFSCVKAEELTFDKTSYSSGEVVRGLFSPQLNILNEIYPENIKLYKGDTKLSTPITLKKYGKETYFYFELPSLENGVYSVKIENLLYYKNNVLTEISSSKDFNVENRDKDIISIFPAFIIEEIDSYEYPRYNLLIKNKGSNSLDLIFSSEASFISLPQGANLNPGKQTSFTIDINPRVINEPTLKGDLVISYSNLSSSVPIIITKRDYTPLLNKVENVTKVELNLDKEELRFTVNQAMINKTVNKDIVLEGTLTFQNFGGVELTNLSFDLTGNLKEITRLSYSSLESLEPGEEQEIHIWVNEDKNLDKDYIGELKITSKEGLTASFPINIHKKIEEIQVKKNETQVPDVEKEICDDKLDNDKDIKIDCEDEDCQGMVDCQKKTNLIPYIVFFSLVLLTILLIIYFYKKGKNPKELSFEKLLGR